MKTFCLKVTEEEVARGLSKDHAHAKELRPALPGWLSSHCEGCSGKLHRVRRIQELTSLGSAEPHTIENVNDLDQAVDSYDAWQKVHWAAEFGAPASEKEEDRLGFVVHLLMEEEERLRFNAPKEGLAAMERAREIVWELVPGTEQDHLVDTKNFGTRRKPRQGLALRALVEARYGNALRYNSKHPEARPVAARSAFLTRTYKVPHFVDGEVHWLYAVLLTDSRQLAAALDTIHHGIDAYRASSDFHQAAMAMMDLADILYRNGCRAEDIVQILDKALEDLDPLRSAHMYYGCQLKHISYNLRAGAIQRSEEIWFRLPPSDHETTELRRKALGGVIQLALGALNETIETLTEAIDSFLKLGMAYDAAALMLYKGEALIRLQQSERGFLELRSAYDLFSALDVDETEKKAFRDLSQMAQAMSLEQLVEQIREQADLVGGCLPKTRKAPYSFGRVNLRG